MFRDFFRDFQFFSDCKDRSGNPHWPSPGIPGERKRGKHHPTTTRVHQAGPCRFRVPPPRLHFAAASVISFIHIARRGENHHRRSRVELTSNPPSNDRLIPATAMSCRFESARPLQTGRLKAAALACTPARRQKKRSTIMCRQGRRGRSCRWNIMRSRSSEPPTADDSRAGPAGEVRGDHPANW